MNENNKLDKENGKQLADLENYEKNLTAALTYVKEMAPNAKIIFASTTPVPEDSAGRIAGDAVRYNEVAAKVLKQFPEVDLNDLYALTKPNHSAWWSKPGNVHFNAKGKTAQAQAVATVLESALQK